jgi:hypothetical protein
LEDCVLHLRKRLDMWPIGISTQRHDCHAAAFLTKLIRTDRAGQSSKYFHIPAFDEENNAASQCSSDRKIERAAETRDQLIQSGRIADVP